MKRRIANKITKLRWKRLSYTQKQLDAARQNADLRLDPHFPMVPIEVWTGFITAVFSSLEKY